MYSPQTLYRARHESGLYPPPKKREYILASPQHKENTFAGTLVAARGSYATCCAAQLINLVAWAAVTVMFNVVLYG